MAWFYRAAQHGNTDAKANLGWLYENGWGVERDYDQALSWFRKAADDGSANAGKQHWLALPERMGSLSRIIRKRRNGNRKAADKDYARAEGNLGWLYQEGKGVKQDYAEAMTLSRKAADKASLRLR